MNKQQLRHEILLFDKSRASTGIRAVKGEITKSAADYEFDRDIALLLEKIDQYAYKYAERVIGENSGSDMNDYELINALKNMYQWGISTGRKLESGKIKQVDDREWGMIASRLDQFEQSFNNRLRRQQHQRNTELSSHKEEE